MEFYIYTLTDPEDKIIKYVGKTKNLEKRLRGHMSNWSIRQEPWTRKNKWLKYLKNKNLSPIIEILDIGDKNNIDSLERYWISQFKCWGFRLKNSTDGGDGVDWTGKKHSDKSKKLMKISNPNKKSIIMYDKNFTPLKKFISLRGAERETGIFRQQIKFSCQLKGTAGGCYFRYEDKEIIEKDDWKDFTNKRNYDYFDYDINLFKGIISKSKSYRDIMKNLNMEYNESNRSLIYKTIKKHNISIEHFSNKLKDNERHKK
jgi:hypothetical protein